MPPPSHQCQCSCINFVRCGYRFFLFLRFFNWILELFKQCGIFFLFYSFLLRSQIKPYSPGYGKKNQLALDNTSSLASVLALYSGNVEFDVKTSYSVNMALTDHANMTANKTWIRILFALRLHYFDRFYESKQQAVTKYMCYKWPRL